MKSVIVVRHAKSSWDDAALPDFERPLNERGKKDAPEMARRLLHKHIPIDAFISSPAKRARKTASLFAAEYGIKKDDIILVPELYHAAPDQLYAAIANAPAGVNSIAVFSHNPGITDFVNSLTGAAIDNMPTCAVFAVKAAIDDWTGFADAAKEFWFFDYPKSGG